MNNPYPDASWSEVGTLVYRLAPWVYMKSIYSGCDIIEVLGTIKPRTDGRWSWWRFKSKHFPKWAAGEGVALTKTGAMYTVHEGMVDPREMSDASPMAETHKYIKDGRTLGVVMDTHTKVFPWNRFSVVSEPTWKRGSGRAISLEDALCQMVSGWT